MLKVPYRFLIKEAELLRDKNTFKNIWILDSKLYLSVSECQLQVMMNKIFKISEAGLIMTELASLFFLSFGSPPLIFLLC